MNQMFRARIRACLLGLLLLSSAPLAFAEYVSASQGYQVSVRVVPRIGGFLSNAYQEAWGSRCEAQRVERVVDWEGYEARLDASVAPLAYRLPYADEELNRDMGVPGWDILTTRSAEGRRDCGYLERRVLVSAFEAPSIAVSHALPAAMPLPATPRGDPASPARLVPRGLSPA